MRAPCTVHVVCFLCLRAWLLLCGCLHARLWIGCTKAGAGTSALLHVRLEQWETHKGLISWWIAEDPTGCPCHPLEALMIGKSLSAASTALQVTTPTRHHIMQGKSGKTGEAPPQRCMLRCSKSQHEEVLRRQRCSAHRLMIVRLIAMRDRSGRNTPERLNRAGPV